MFKTLFRDSLLYSTSSILARGMSFITVPLFTRVLTPTDYGALDLLSYVILLGPLILGLSLDQAVARFYIDTEDVFEKKKIASTVILHYTIIIFALVLLLLPTAPWFSSIWLQNQVDLSTIIIVFICMYIRSLYYAANNQLKWMFLSKKFTICNVGYVIVSTCASLYFVVILHMGVKGVFLGQILGGIIFTILSLYYGRGAYAFIFDWQIYKKLIAYSGPLVPASISFFLMQYVDRFALKELTSLRDVGIYGIGARVASLIQLMLMGFQGAYNPLVIKHYKDPNAPENFAKVLNYFFVGTLIMLVIVSIFGKEILIILTTPAFYEGYTVVPLLAGSAILSSIAIYFTQGIIIAKKTKYRAYINIGGVVLNVVLNITLIHFFGFIGAALATFISFLIMAVIAMKISQKYYFVPYEWNRIFPVLFFVMCSIVSIFVIKVPQIGLELLFKFSIVFITLFSFLLFGLIRREDLLKIKLVIIKQFPILSRKVKL